MTCDDDPVPNYGECNFKCDPGYDLKGYSWDICIDGEWYDDTPTCERECTKVLFLEVL